MVGLASSMCVCVNCRMTVCYNYHVRERGSVVGKVLCDEDSRLRKGLWQRLKDRKGREIGGVWVNSWHSRHSLPEIAVLFLSPVLCALHPFFSACHPQQFAVIYKCRRQRLAMPVNLKITVNTGPKGVHLCINNNAEEWQFKLRINRKMEGMPMREWRWGTDDVRKTD